MHLLGVPSLQKPWGSASVFYPCPLLKLYASRILHTVCLFVRFTLTYNFYCILACSHSCMLSLSLASISLSLSCSFRLPSCLSIVFNRIKRHRWSSTLARSFPALLKLNPILCTLSLGVWWLGYCPSSHLTTNIYTVCILRIWSLLRQIIVAFHRLRSWAYTSRNLISYLIKWRAFLQFNVHN